MKKLLLLLFIMSPVFIVAKPKKQQFSPRERQLMAEVAKRYRFTDDLAWTLRKDIKSLINDLGSNYLITPELAKKLLNIQFHIQVLHLKGNMPEVSRIEKEQFVKKLVCKVIPQLEAKARELRTFFVNRKLKANQPTVDMINTIIADLEKLKGDLEA